MRVSVDQINKGQNWHWDDARLGETEDTSRTHPGISCVVHTGHDAEDVVGVDFVTNLDRRYACRPGTAYAFPGYAIEHRTERLFRKTKKGKRYSFDVWLPCKDDQVAKMDDYIHNRWGRFCNDNYEERKRLNSKSGDNSFKRNHTTAFGDDDS